MPRRARPPKPTWVAWLVCCLALVLILAAYVGAANYLVGADIPTSHAQADRRDTIYFTIHAAALVGALLVGFVLGKWLNGLGVAFGLLFFVVVASSVTVAQVATYQAACDGHNDIIRHWTC